MKRLQTKKNKMLLGLAVILIVIISIPPTMAYFTDEDTEKNTFTMGKVTITLAEPHWKEESGQKIKPGTVVHKDPTVKAERGLSYMRIKVKILDEEGEFIQDQERLDLILDTLYYDTSYGNPDASELTGYLIPGNRYEVFDLKDLLDRGLIYKEYNQDAFAFAGIEAGNPAIRYYNYIASDGLFDVGDSAVLFSNTVLPKDWMNDAYFTLAGKEGKGYQIVLEAEAIQTSEFETAEDAFRELDDILSITRDTSGI